jgi:hypothetical protein
MKGIVDYFEYKTSLKYIVRRQIPYKKQIPYGIGVSRTWTDKIPMEHAP